MLIVGYTAARRSVIHCLAIIIIIIMVILSAISTESS